MTTDVLRTHIRTHVHRGIGAKEESRTCSQVRSDMSYAVSCEQPHMASRVSAFRTAPCRDGLVLYGLFGRGLLARCRGNAVRVSINGFIVATGATVSSQDSLPKARTTKTSVRNEEPAPLSRLRKVRTLIPALSARVTCSRFRSIRSRFRRSPSSVSSSAGV